MAVREERVEQARMVEREAFEDDIRASLLYSLANSFDHIGLLDFLKGHNGPPKLCIDGREYHRRQWRRAKRGR